jgi:hypothetical protein
MKVNTDYQKLTPANRQPTTRNQLQLTTPIPKNQQGRDDIFKLLRSPGVDFKESILPAVVACRAGTRTETRQPTVNNRQKEYICTIRQGWRNRIYCTVKEIDMERCQEKNIFLLQNASIMYLHK